MAITDINMSSMSWTDAFTNVQDTQAAVYDPVDEKDASAQIPERSYYWSSGLQQTVPVNSRWIYGVCIGVYSVSLLLSGLA